MMESKDNEARPATPSAVWREPIPEPPWRADRRARAAPRIPLTREAILDAALRVLDREGLDGLSMRRVAEELGTGAASLYWHVHNKDELLQLLSERLAEEIPLPDPDPSRWQEQLKEVGRAMRAAMKRHRDAARITLGRLPSGPTIVRVTEWLFALMAPIGVPDRVITYAGDLASLYVGAYAFEESLGLASPTGEDLPPEQIMAMLRDYIRSLPPDKYPYIHRALAHLFAGDPDERFEFGLDVLIRGIQSYARSDAVNGGDRPKSAS